MVQRKVVTALFCDVVGSTALGESVDPLLARARLRPDARPGRWDPGDVLATAGRADEAAAAYEPALGRYMRLQVRTPA